MNIKTKKIALILGVIFILTICCAMLTAFAAPAQKDQYGGTVDANGVLTIDGSVATIGESAYVNRTDITAIVIKEGVKTISKYAFFGCSNVASIILPDGLEEIGLYAFEYCAIEEISIPDSVIKMGQDSFNMCADLKSYIQPENVEYYSTMTAMGYGMTSLQEFRVTQSMVDNNVHFVLPEDTWYLSTDTTKSFEVSGNGNQHSADWGVGTYVRKEETVKLAAPATVKAVSQNYSTLKVSWSEVEGADGYKIYRSDSENGEYKLIYTSAADKLYVNNLNRITGKTYYYKVAALKDGVEGVLSEAKAGKSQPKKPANVKVKSVTANKLNVSWNAVEGAQGYKLYCSTSGKDGTFYLSYTTWNPNKLNVNVLNRVPGKTYYFKVRAIAKYEGATVNGTLSAVVSGKTIA